MPNESIGILFFQNNSDICIIKFKTLHYGTTDIQIFAYSVQF